MKKENQKSKRKRKRDEYSGRGGEYRGEGEVRRWGREELFAYTRYHGTEGGCNSAG